MNIDLTKKQKIVLDIRPRFEGTNIETWVGFKHQMYLMEEGVLEFFRVNDIQPSMLIYENGLCLEIVDSEIEILDAIHIDDLVRVEVSNISKNTDKQLNFSVQMFIVNKNLKKASKGLVKVIFRNINDNKESIQSEPFIYDAIRNENFISALDIKSAVENFNHDSNLGKNIINLEGNLILWKRYIPYFYCHHSNYLQHSGYIRLMEEVVDLFLKERGISINHMLQTKNWIPVVPKAHVELLNDAYIEEEIYIAYKIGNIYKDYLYTSNFECFVNRDEQYIQVATGSILHGYAEIVNPLIWKLVPFDEETKAALNNEVIQYEKN